MFRPCHQDDSVRMNIFPLSQLKKFSSLAVLRDRQSAISIWRYSACAETSLNNSPLASKYLYRKFPAVFACHGPLECFQQVGGRAVVILELFRAITDLDPRLLAQKLVMRCFIHIGEPSPPAYV